MLRVANKKIVWNRLPQGVVPLFFIQVFATLSFSVLYSTLALYMTGKLGLSIKLANSVTGIFVALNFTLHLLGGYCGGRFFSNRALFCFSMFAQIVGCILLASINVAYLYYGLATFLIGCGLNVACVNCMLRQRFKPQDQRRETVFLWNYAGMNIGFFTGFSLSGYFQLSQNYQRLFLLSSLGNLVALFICLYCWHSLADHETVYSRLSRQKKRQASLVGILVILCMPLLLSQLIHFANWANKLVLFTGGLMLAVACWLAFQQNVMDAQKKMLAFVVLMLVSTVFWMLYQNGPMGLTYFIDNNVDLNWLMMTIPPQWFQNINTLSIVIGGPLLSSLLNHLRSRGIPINIPVQFAWALLLISLAFIILPVGIISANSVGLVAPGCIFLSFILQSAGELLIAPIGYAMVGALIPNSLQGVMMGMWMLSTGVGAILSSYSSNWMMGGQDSISPVLTNSSYSRVFLELGLIALVAALLVFILRPRLCKWIENMQSEVVNEANAAVVNNSVIITPTR